nr:hypothetical protein BaRGS_009135 [Batillaria attramentaria]
MLNGTSGHTETVTVLTDEVTTESATVQFVVDLTTVTIFGIIAGAVVVICGTCLVARKVKRCPRTKQIEPAPTHEAVREKDDESDEDNDLTDEVVEEDQTEDADEEKAVMIVNSKSVGGNAENKEYSGRLAEYGEVADAKGMEGGTRPASVVQPSAASSASESGAANGEHVSVSEVLELSKRQNDEDEKQ